MSTDPDNEEKKCLVKSGKDKPLIFLWYYLLILKQLNTHKNRYIYFIVQQITNLVQLSGTDIKQAFKRS